MHSYYKKEFMNQKKIMVAETSCRMVSWTEFENEITRNALTIIEKA